MLISQPWLCRRFSNIRRTNCAKSFTNTGKKITFLETSHKKLEKIRFTNIHKYAQKRINTQIFWFVNTF